MTNFVGKLFSKSKEGQKIGGSVPEKKYHCFLICDFFYKGTQRLKFEERKSNNNNKNFKI